MNFNDCYYSACEYMDTFPEGGTGKHLRFWNFSFLITEMKFNIPYDKLKLYAVFNIERKKKMMIKKYYQKLIDILKETEEDFKYETTQVQRDNNKKYSVCLKEVERFGPMFIFTFNQTRLFPTFFLDLIIIYEILKDVPGAQVLINAKSVNLLFEGPLLYKFTDEVFNNKIKESHDKLIDHWKTKNLNWQSEIRIHRAYYSSLENISEFN